MSSDATFYNLRRLHALFALAAAALLAATVWMIVADHYRPWRAWQRTYRDEIAPRLTQARLTDVRAELARGEKPNAALQADEQRLAELLARQSPSLAKRILGWPIIDALARPQAIEQIWLPRLTIDSHFGHTARCDRCPTCHQGIGRSEQLSLPQPFAGHPRSELFAGDRSPHPAAEFGCTICHDGQGSATEFSLASHRPNAAEEGDAWRRQHKWGADSDWELPMLPKRFVESRCLQCHYEPRELEASERFSEPAAKLVEGFRLVEQLGCFGCHEINGYDERGWRVGPDLRLAAASSARGIPPGRMEKVGPSLRDVGRRLSGDYLAAWIAEPVRQRPATRMPRFFGMHEHLDGQTLADARRFEDVEIQAISAYLLAASRKVSDPAATSAVSSAAKERGQRLFQFTGCLACHRHSAFPPANSSVGPDLSGVGAKYTSPAAREWLASWIRDPAQSNPRSKMPRLERPTAWFAESAADPAVELAAWLSATPGEKPPQPPAVAPGDLDELTAQYLRGSAPEGDGSPAAKLQYVGRQAIRKRGCFGCHEIPGFESGPLIGPNLSDWGRKRTELLAFERVEQFLATHEPPAGSSQNAYYVEAVRQKTRGGFAWQKLRAPRSFDYQTARRKSFQEMLLMGRFTLSGSQREAIVTFLLGLTAQPPADRYVAHDARLAALAAGRTVIDKYGCAECHTLGMERWTIEYKPAEFGAPPARTQFSEYAPQLPVAALAASLRADRRGLARAELLGAPRLDARGELEEGEDDDGRALHFFTLWTPAAIAGRVWSVGGAEVPVGKSQLTQRRPAWGGAFPRLVFPQALAHMKATGTVAAAAEAWGWLPPPLVGEGRRAQPEWLYQYLLAPRSIRPAAAAVMPKFALTPDEARRLVDYFAVTAGVEGPYLAPAPQQIAAGDHVDAARRRRLAQAWSLLHDRKTFCAKCHAIGASTPGGETRATWAPNLAEVGRRIRPDYLRRWLADPKSIIPYTPMPVNFPPTGEPLGQDLLPAASGEQLDVVCDLLINYTWWVGQAAPAPAASGK